MRVILTRQAQAEYVEAVEWYSSQGRGLGKRLREDFRVVRARIAAKPLHFPSTVGGARRAQLRDFPYLVIFRLADDVAEIIAFFHMSGDPARWQRRAQ
jgi:plasmid stabilization system protein ParE